MLTYGEKEVLRFVYDNELRKIVIEVREPVKDGDYLITYSTETIVARGVEFDAVMEQLMPVASGARERLESTAKAMAEDQKLARINKADEQAQSLKNM